jgi:hypothetical protein
MWKKGLMGPLVLTGLLLLSCTPAIAEDSASDGVMGEAVRVKSMRDYIDNLYKDAVVVHTFVKNGDEITCIDAHTQPALRRPEMVGRAFDVLPPLVGCLAP